MLLWVYIYSAYVECNLGQFAYFTFFFFCLKEQFKRKEKKKVHPRMETHVIMSDLEVPQSSVSGTEVGAWEFTSGEHQS